MTPKIKFVSSEDIHTFKSLLSIFESVFEMEPYERPDDARLQRLLAKDDFIVMVAELDGIVIGRLTAYLLEQYYSTRPLAYIYDLAVSTEHQRKGVGAQLIAAFNVHCRDRGFEEVFVQADRVDDYALDFYRKTAPSAEEDVVHFYYRF